MMPSLSITHISESELRILPKLECFLDIFLFFDTDGRLKTLIFDNRDGFNFPIVDFPFLSSSIPSVSSQDVSRFGCHTCIHTLYTACDSCAKSAPTLLSRTTEIDATRTVYLVCNFIDCGWACSRNPLGAFGCCLLYGRVVAALTHSPFPFSILFL